MLQLLRLTVTNADPVDPFQKLLDKHLLTENFTISMSTRIVYLVYVDCTRLCKTVRPFLQSESRINQLCFTIC